MNKENEMLKCTSKTTQNEIISIIADYIQEHTTKSLQLSTSVFSIIADEVTGKYDNKEILSICVSLLRGRILVKCSWILWS